MTTPTHSHKAWTDEGGHVKLKLAQFRSQWQAAEQQATADGWSPASYLYVLAEQEHQQRHQPRLRWLLHEAQLPWPKTLADYHWSAIPDLDHHQIEQLAHDTSWLDRAENLLLFGPSGVGKTHLASGICRSLGVPPLSWTPIRGSQWSVYEQR